MLHLYILVIIDCIERTTVKTIRITIEMEGYSGSLPLKLNARVVPPSLDVLDHTILECMDSKWVLCDVMATSEVDEIIYEL